MESKEKLNLYKLKVPNTNWDAWMFKLSQDKKTAKDVLNDYIYNDVKPFADKLGIKLIAPTVAEGTANSKKAIKVPNKKSNQINAFTKSGRARKERKPKTKKS